jgi:hypothetical protein
MINPVLSNFRIEFGESFFPSLVCSKYDDFLFHKNYPFKTLKSYFYETIQELSIPGINLNTIFTNGLNNLGQNPNINDFPHVTINRSYPGTSPINEIVESVSIIITFRNTLINWMYAYEVLYRHYSRTRSMSDFYIQLIMKDSAEIDMIKFNLSDCFIAGMPGLTFSYLQSFSETKTFDITFNFNKFEVEFLIPGFDFKNIQL